MCCAELCRKGEYRMKTWFDWMDDCYVPAVTEMSDAQTTQRIKARVQERLSVQTHRAKRFSFRRVAILAAAAALAVCIGVGAMAASVFPWDGVFGTFFGAGAQSQAASLGMPGEGLALSASNGGCTLTLEGVLFDGEQMYLPLTLTMEDETPNPTLSYYAMGQTAGGEGGASRVLEDDNLSDRSVKLMCTLQGGNWQSGDTITWNIQYLYATRPMENGTEVAWEKEGNWSFTFKVPQAEQAQAQMVSAGTSEPVTGISIAQIRLTPMRVTVVFDGLPEEAGVRDTLSEAQIILTLSDGSTCTMGTFEEGVRAAQGSIDEKTSPIDGAYYEVSCEYGEFIAPDEVEAVSINGLQIPIE